ncbi:MAG: AsmA family protein [Planctomycetota bacterium]|jgi:hypothetical protein
MKKSFRALRSVLVVVVVLIVVVALAVGLFADRAVKAGIEAGGKKALNVGVSVGDVDLSIMGGRIGFQNLSIDNPPGYQHDKLLELRDGRIAVDIGSLLSDTVKIREIRLDGMDMVLEQRGVSGNNLQDIIKSIPTKDTPEAEPSGKKLHIDSLEITGVTVKVKVLPVPGKGDTITLPLKPITMTNLGSDDKLDAAVLSGKVLLAVAGGIAEQGAGVLPDEIIGPVTSELKRLKALPEALLKESAEVLKEGTDLGKGITEGIKGLFKPREKKGEETTP